MLTELLKLDPIKVLCEHVSGVISSRDENDGDFVIPDAFMYVVIADINVFGLLLLYRDRKSVV